MISPSLLFRAMSRTAKANTDGSCQHQQPNNKVPRVLKYLIRLSAVSYGFCFFRAHVPSYRRQFASFFPPSRRADYRIRRLWMELRNATRKHHLVQWKFRVRGSVTRFPEIFLGNFLLSRLSPERQRFQSRKF